MASAFEAERRQSTTRGRDPLMTMTDRRKLTERSRRILSRLHYRPRGTAPESWKMRRKLVQLSAGDFAPMSGYALETTRSLHSLGSIWARPPKPTMERVTSARQRPPTSERHPCHAGSAHQSATVPF